MHIDCVSCPVRGQRCDDCMVTTLLTLEAPAPAPFADSNGLPLDAAESRAVTALVEAGLVSPRDAARARAEPVSGARWEQVG